MQYHSTRSITPLGSFSDILLTGLAPDGGLAMPETLPQITLETLTHWRNLGYQALALEIMQLFIDDIDRHTLNTLLQRAYTSEKFNSPCITPVSQFGDTGRYLLALSNGPSLAFKDIAMQFLGEVFQYTLEKRQQTLNILGATSGDTGSAAEYAMLGKENVSVFMLSPHGRMSAFQQAQMYSLNEKNIYNLAIKGVFDDCQDLVKTLNQDAQFKRTYSIGAVNSINWARILAQTVYYFKAYLALADNIGEEMDFAVPSGNFGNVFAGYLAKEMGLPIGRLVVASNENDVLYEFFQTGTYRLRHSGQIHSTSSPSMDIGKASNLERYLYLISGADVAQTANWFNTLAEKGEITLSDKALSAMRESGFIAYRSTHSNRIETIKTYYQKFNTLIDPHTADGVFAAEQAQRAGIKMVCLETALPSKFSATIEEALGFAPEIDARFVGIEDKPRFVTVLDNDALALKQFMVDKLARK